MLALRPNCECCGRDLPPDSRDALICSFECTWCVDCARTKLPGSLCPNCGGNLVPRPIRPTQDWNGRGNALHNNPAATKAKHRRADLAAHAELLQRLAGRPPGER